MSTNTQPHTKAEGHIKAGGSSLEPEIIALRAAVVSEGVLYRQLAEATGMNYVAVKKVMAGACDARARTLASLAGVLGVSAETMRQAGREDVAQIINAAPTVRQATDDDLRAELERRQREA